MNCDYCGYCQILEDGTLYCNDLDCTIDGEPVCSKENYNS